MTDEPDEEALAYEGTADPDALGPEHPPPDLLALAVELDLAGVTPDEFAAYVEALG